MEYARSRPGATAIAGTVLLGVLVAALVPTAGETFGVVAVIVGQLATVVIGLRAARAMPGQERTAWRLISLAFLFTSIGVITTGVLSQGFGIEVPKYSAVDLLFVTGYVSFLTGIFLLPAAARRGTDRLRILVDAAVAAISVSVLAWIWALDSIATSIFDAGPWQRTLGLTYPVLNVIGLVGLIAVFLRKRHEMFDVRLVLLTVALVFQTIADMVFAVAAGRNLEDATPVIWLFGAASLFYLLTAISLSWRQVRVQAAERAPAIWPLFIPYGVAFVLLVTLVARAIDTGFERDVVWLIIGVGLVAVLIAVRQIAAIRDLAATVEMERRALIASVSHELRTPLTAMIGFLEVLEDPDLDLPPEEFREFVGMVGQQSRYLARIVGDLTMLARSGNDVFALDRRPVTFATIVSRVTDSLEMDLRTMTVDAPDGLLLDADAERLQQVLINLIVNAVRYGGSEILLRAVVEGRDVRLEVHDSGAGVPPRYQYVMWERFNRAAHHLNATVPGSGIGLAIVKLLAELHGGRATYRRSELLGGACFAVDLPAAVPASVPTPAAHDAAVDLTRDEPVPEYNSSL